MDADGAPHDAFRTDGQDGDGVGALAELAAAGFPVAAMDAEQRAVLAALTGEELRVLCEVKQRLDGVQPDVQAHEAAMVGGLFF